MLRMNNTNQSTTLFATHKSILLSCNCSNRSAINNCITVRTSLSHTDALPHKCNQKPRNTQKQKYDIYLTQPIKYSTKAKNDRKGVVYPISFFHGHIPLPKFNFILLALTALKAPADEGELGTVRNCYDFFYLYVPISSSTFMACR